MTAIPRYRSRSGPVMLSAGFRPFFLLSAIWAALGIPLWLAVFAGEAQIMTALPLTIWHVHEMVFGFGAATVAGFLLTAIPNWTGRLPLQGGPLGLLVLLWAAGRLAILLSGKIGVTTAAALDLSFPVVFLAVVARELIAGRNWRNLPILLALFLLLLGNVLVHLDMVGASATAELGNRLGVATLLMLISLVGGRIIPSFTGNWLTKRRPEIPAPAPFDLRDRTALGALVLGLGAWVLVPEEPIAPWLELFAGIGLALRLVRWRGAATLREPLLWVLHLGYGWLALGLLLLAAGGFMPALPQTTAIHALTIGAIGTMTLAVMTRATLGHTGRPLAAGPRTTTIYLLVTLAAVLRLTALLGGSHYLLMLSLAGAAWSGAFGLFVFSYLPLLAVPPVNSPDARPI
jgi:uncharacterized protein involved in response to NO